jgi:putative ABC transport system permease protein
MTVEQLVRAMLARSLPKRIAGEAADDLFEDHRRLRETRGDFSAALFLIREATSLVGAFVVAGMSRFIRSVATLRRDVAHAVRAVMRRPGSSLGAILMLAAGLAAVAASSGLASTLLFRPISARYPDEVRRLASSDLGGRTRLAFSEVELERVRDSMAGVANIAVANLQPVVLRVGDTDMQTLAEVVGGPYFDMLGLDVAVGRPLVDGDGAAGAPPVAVISEGLWRDHFGRQASAMGAVIRLNGRAFTIVGITASKSTSSFLGGSVDAWIALAHADAMLDRSWRTNPDNRWWTTLVHADAAATARVDAALERATAALAVRLPEPWRERKLITVPGTVMAGSQRTAAVTLSIVLTGFALLILAAASANVSGLFLAAAAANRGRAAIQLAIGSGRAAIVRRHMFEGALLGAGGGVAALGVYAWVRRQLVEVALLPTLSLRLDLPFDAPLIGLTIGAGIVAGLLLALGPALWITRLDISQTLRDGAGRAAGGAALSRARRILVAAQVAISITLLAGASLFARSVDTLAMLDVGFSRAGLIALDFDVEPSAPSPEMLPGLAREALDRAAAVPGVVAAAMSNRAPIDSSTPAVSVSVPGSGSRPVDDVTFYLATERYFETVGLAIVSGRAFNAAEVARESDVAIVNETLAQRLWPDGDAIDRALLLQPEGRTVRIVGIARDSKYRSLSERQRPHLYLPTAPNFSRALLVRTQDDPRRAMLAVQAALDQVGPGVIGFFPRTLDDHLAIDMLPARASANAAGVLAALALVLSAVGLYGIVMWFVEVRRREIGVRVALGASAANVRRLIVGEAAMAAAPGLVIGLLMAIALTLFGQSLFVGIGAVDPVSLVLGIVTLSAIVLAASYLPSRRATQVDPVIVLRNS